jgi:hypothetical protein
MADKLLVTRCTSCGRTWFSEYEDPTRCSGPYHQSRRSRCILEVIYQNGKFTDAWQRVSEFSRTRVFEAVQRVKGVDLQAPPPISVIVVLPGENRWDWTGLSQKRPLGGFFERICEDAKVDKGSRPLLSLSSPFLLIIFPPLTSSPIFPLQTSISSTSATGYSRLPTPPRRLGCRMAGNFGERRLSPLSWGP